MQNKIIPEEISSITNAIYEISDDENGITIFRTDSLKEILAVIFPFGKGAPIPIEVTKRVFLIRDNDGISECVYDGKKLSPYRPYD